MRRKLMNELETKDNTIVYDSTSIDWTSFPWDQGYYLHYITRAEIQKPYLIAYAYYGDVQYEDILLLLNNIEDVWDIQPDTEIRIPKLEELKKWIIDNSK